MAQQKKPSAKKKAVAPKKRMVAAPVKPKARAKPTYERLHTARLEADAAQDQIRVAIRHLNRAKSFYGDFDQRDRLVAEASDNLALAREQASEARANFDRLSTEAK